MSDLISRKAAIDALDSVFIDDESYKVWFKLAVKNLPSAQPEREKGKWYIDAEGNVRCTDCKTKCLRDDIGVNILSSYCPNCGADMRGEQDE